MKHAQLLRDLLADEDALREQINEVMQDLFGMGPLQRFEPRPWPWETDGTLVCYSPQNMKHMLAI